MNRSVFVCLVWLVGSFAAAQNQNLSQSAPGSKALLIALENAWNQAQLHHDSKALDELLAETFISTDDDGTLMTKAQFLDDNKDPSYAPSVMANTEEQVFLYEYSAVVAGIYHAKGMNNGKPFEHFGRFTDTWIYVNGKWLCAATHTSLLKNNRYKRATESKSR